LVEGDAAVPTRQHDHAEHEVDSAVCLFGVGLALLAVHLRADAEGEPRLIDGQ
jgi:hypothetical protein